MRRFITLVDTLYDAHVKMAVLAAAPPMKLVIQPDDGHDVDEEELSTPRSIGKDLFDELFAFDRTTSRLLDMQSQEYPEAPGSSSSLYFYLSLWPYLFPFLFFCCCFVRRYHSWLPVKVLSGVPDTFSI